MTATLDRNKGWMSVEGNLQPLNNGGLAKLRESDERFWFAMQDSSLLYYEQRNTQAPPNAKPRGSIDIFTATLDVFVAVTSSEGKEYLLSPGQGVCLTDWLADLKNKTAFANATAATLERSNPSQGWGFMNRVRSSFRRKKRATRSVSQDSGVLSSSLFPSPTEKDSGRLPSPTEGDRQPRRERSLTYPSETEDNIPPSVSQLLKDAVKQPCEVKTFEDKACDTTSLDWVMPEFGESTEGPLCQENRHSSTRPPLPDVREFPWKDTEALPCTIEGLRDSDQSSVEGLPDSCQSNVQVLHDDGGQPSTQGFRDEEQSNMVGLRDRDQSSGEGLRDSELPGRQCLERSTEMDYRREENLLITKLRTLSAGSQTTDTEEDCKETLTLQQRKMIRELEIEVCKLKCEVISLIQGSIKVPLKDDDLADWHYVEEIRYKDRIFELLKEARLCNPKLPNFDSSKSGSFKDGYGFIHGSRESESVVFHYVCRELTEHYSSFYQDKSGHVQFWAEYTKAKKQKDDKIMYIEKELKSLVRDGVPVACRSAVWMSFVHDKVDSIRKAQGPGFYQRQVNKISKRMHTLKAEMSDVERQIKCDLLRTMPTNDRFKTLDSEGVSKLSRVLHAFVDYLPDIGYLQGMNFLVGLLLLLMEEEEAFWSLVAVVEVYLENYFDRILSGAQADQEVLKEIVSEMLPALHAHFKYYGVDISTVCFNWFITVYLDAVPFETALRIWDSFLFEGREALFRIAIGLLKLQQRSLLQLSGPLEIMQYMKRSARVTYDVDRLFKASFDEISKFPSNEKLDEMQRKHRSDIVTKYDYKLTVKHERKRSRVSSFTVEIPTRDKQERLDQYQIVECAVATSNDLSSPVCILCSSRGETKLYLLDINRKEMSTLEVTISSRVLCAEVLADGTVLIGTVSWHVYAFNLEYREEIWCVQLNDSVVDLSHYAQGQENKVYAAMADGSIALLPNANGAGPPSEGSHVRIGNAPVTCVTLIDHKVWCGCGNNVVVLDSSSLEELHATVVSSSPRHQVARLLAGNHGVWYSIRGSSWVALMDPNSYELLLKVDVSLDTILIDAANQSQVTVSPFQDSRVTTIMAFNDELWVGLGNGQVMIFDITDNERYEQESYVLLKEDSAEKETREPDVKETEQCDESQAIRSTAVNQNTPDADSTQTGRKRAESNDMVSTEFKFSLKMRVHYRVSEEAIRSLVILRESDPMVLSCAGTLSAEGGLYLWQQQSEPDSTEWIPCPIKHRMRPRSYSSPATPKIGITVAEASIY